MGCTGGFFKLDGWFVQSWLKHCYDVLQILEYVICFACKSTNSTHNYTANWMAIIAYNHESCEPTDHARAAMMIQLSHMTCTWPSSIYPPGGGHGLIFNPYSPNGSRSTDFDGKFEFSVKFYLKCVNYFQPKTHNNAVKQQLQFQTCNLVFRLATRFWD